MKFGQLIKDNMRNIFVEKSYTKCAGETIPSAYLYQQCEVLNSLFVLYANLRAIERQWNQAADHLLLPNLNPF